MNKKYSIFMAAMCGVLTFTGCSGQTNTASEAVTQEENTAAVVESTEQKDEEAPRELVYEENEKLAAAVDAVAYSYVQSSLATDNNKVVPGAQVLVLKDGKIVLKKAYGVQQAFDWTSGEGVLLENTVPMQTTTMIDLASCTKISATTQAVMKLVTEGKLDVKEKVVTYLPEFGQNGKENVTVEDLLTHTSGLPQWRPMFLYCDTKEEVLDYICNTSLMFEPGEYYYSDLGFLTLGFLVEKVSGQSLDAYVKTNIYEPLGMVKTGYLPLENGIAKEEIAASSFGNPYEYCMVDEKNYPDFGYDCTEDKEAFAAFDGWRNYTLIGEVNDGNAGMGCKGVAGHAGVFSNVEELAILYQALLDGGSYNGVELYSPEVLAQFTTDRMSEGQGCYGFATGSSWMTALSDTAFGHNGFTGQYITVDPQNQIVTILLTNKMNAGLTEEHMYNNLTDFAKAFNNAVHNEYVAE